MFFYLSPLPRRSVSDKIVPPEIDFKKFVVVAATFGFLILAPKAIPIKGAATLTTGLRNLFPVVCVPLITFS